MVDADDCRATAVVERIRPTQTPNALSAMLTPLAETSIPAAEFPQVSPTRRSTWRRISRRWIILGATTVVVVLLVGQRRLVASSFEVLGHLKWLWLLAAVPLELVSMAALARMQGRLLTAGRAPVPFLPVVATVYAGNAISATVPLAGPQMGTVFAFRRFKQLGLDVAVVAWTLVVGGLTSSLAAALLLTVGALLTGNDVVAATGAAGGIVGVGVLVATIAAVRCPAVRKALHRPVAWILTQAGRQLGRPSDDLEGVARGLAARWQSTHLPVSSWAMVALVAVMNWLADAGVLGASVAAVGAPVPWRGLLLAYGAGMAASTISITPGGLGVTEAALSLSLMGVGVRHPLALAAALVYRFVSFWLVVSVGWLTYVVVSRTSNRPTPFPRHLPAEMSCSRCGQMWPTSGTSWTTASQRLETPKSSGRS
jgi:hypothetical protein